MGARNYDSTFGCQTTTFYSVLNPDSLGQCQMLGQYTVSTSPPKENERSGEPIDLRDLRRRETPLMCIWQGPDWAWGHVRLEALLSSRSVYGNRRDVNIFVARP